LVVFVVHVKTLWVSEVPAMTSEVTLDAMVESSPTKTGTDVGLPFEPAKAKAFSGASKPVVFRFVV
jgi:hypothetical protein